MSDVEGPFITVCSSCKQASCWQGVFYCDNYKEAGTIQVSKSNLIWLNIEHESYFLTDDEFNLQQQEDDKKENKMGYGTDGLTFNTLRGANLRRLPEFRNANGEICHTHPTGGDWSPNDWMTAITGEVGELANKLKKLRRGDYTLEEMLPAIVEEMADVVIYMDILAIQFGIDLGKAVKDKFNLVSERVNSRVYIGNDGDWHLKGV